MEAHIDPADLERASYGDAAAFGRLAEARAAIMLRTAMAITGRDDEAREAVEDALVTAWRELGLLRNPGSLRHPGAFDAWLTRIVVDRCRRGPRPVVAARSRETPAGLVADETAPAWPDVGPDAVERTSLERAFERLSVDERSILVSHHLNGLPDAGIAAVPGLPAGTAMARLLAAHTALERALERAEAPAAGPTSEDDLRAMLEDRAGRVAPSTAPAVLAAARAAIAGGWSPAPGPVPATGRGRVPVGAPGPAHGTSDGAAFAIRPVEAMPKRSAMVWRLVVLGVATAVAFAVIGSRLEPGRPRRGDPNGRPAGTLAPAPTAAPGVTAGPSAGAATLGTAGVRQRIARGELDGRTLVVAGPLEILRLCRVGSGPDCFVLRVPSLDGVFVETAAFADATRAAAAIAAHAAERPLVLQAHDGRVTLLGWLATGTAAELSVRHLVAGGPAALGTDLAVVSGWLVAGEGVASCATRACATLAPWLTDVGPLPDDTPPTWQDGASVRVTADATLGPGPWPAFVGGPFLVAAASEGGAVSSAPFAVIGRWDPSRVVRLTDAPSAWHGALMAADVAGVLRDGSLDDRLLAVDGTLRPTGDCGYGTADCALLALDGLPGIPILWHGRLTAAGGTRVDVGPVTGRLILRPQDGGLELVGRLAGSLEAPRTIDVEVRSRGPRSTDPFELHAVAGWLVVGGLHSCPPIGPGAAPCPGPGPMLTPAEPTAEGIMTSDVQVPVDVAADAAGVATGRVVTPGPFLVRTVLGSTCDGGGTRTPAPGCLGGPRWEATVVARYVAADVAIVVLP